MHGKGFNYFYPGEHDTNAVLCSASQTGTNYFQTSDFNDWRMVTIGLAGPTVRGTTYINLPGLRTAKSINLYLPHVSFLTTPSYLAQWATNVSNSARTITNQTLIVGLRGDVSGAHLVPLSIQPAVDPNHAQQTACYACHQDLDPMRQFYRQSLTLTFSDQRDPNVKAIPAMFAFDGVTSAGTGLDDFAKAISTHPSFASTWVQKDYNATLASMGKTFCAAAGVQKAANAGGKGIRFWYGCCRRNRDVRLVYKQAAGLMMARNYLVKLLYML